MEAANEFSLLINFIYKELKVAVSHTKNICRYTVDLFDIELDTLKIKMRLSNAKLKKPIANVKRMIEQKKLSYLRGTPIISWLFIIIEAKLFIPNCVLLRFFYDVSF